MIKSVNYNQHNILKDILSLCNLEYFEADISFGNGSFYKNTQEPKLKFDISPRSDGVISSCSTSLPIKSHTLRSIIFDPPFLTYVKSAREHNSIMAKRFGGYWRYEELESHYRDTIKEVYRVLSKKGVFIFKCQDIIHNHKLVSTHINIVNWCAGLFRLKDMFILTAKSRMPMPEKEGEKKRTQKHARIYHSYFLVLEKL